MKILSANTTQAGLVVLVPVDTQATSSGNETKTQNVKESSPVQEAPKKQVNVEEVKKAVEDINYELKSKNRSIQFSIDDKLKDVIVKIVDTSSGEVLLQIPPEEVLQLRERLKEMSGLLIKKTV